MKTERMAIVLGMIGALCACQRADSQEEYVEVVAASRSMPEGTTIDADLIMKVRLPANLAVPGLLTGAEIEKVVGQRIRVPMERGQLVHFNQFLVPDPPLRLSAVVRTRGRGLTLPMDGLGWIRPNDHVDILATLPDPKSGQLATLTLLQNVIVLAVGSQTGSTPPPEQGPDPLAGKLTVMLLPEEVEILTMAARAGWLTVSLRNPEDITDVPKAHARPTEALFGREPSSKAPPSAKAPPAEPGQTR